MTTKENEKQYTWLYTFTVTLNPRKGMFNEVAETQYDQTIQEIKGVLADHKDGILVAELTKAFNIHYHGAAKLVVKGRNAVKEFRDSFRKLCRFGNIDIKVCDDESGWLEYILKDVRQTYKDLGRPPVVVLADYWHAKKLIQDLAEENPCYFGGFILPDAVPTEGGAAQAKQEKNAVPTGGGLFPDVQLYGGIKSPCKITIEYPLRI